MGKEPVSPCPSPLTPHPKAWGLLNYKSLITAIHNNTSFTWTVVEYKRTSSDSNRIVVTIFKYFFSARHCKGLRRLLLSSIRQRVGQVLLMSTFTQECCCLPLDTAEKHEEMQELPDSLGFYSYPFYGPWQPSAEVMVTFALRDHWRLLRDVQHQLAHSPLGTTLSPISSAFLGVRHVARGLVYPSFFS